MARTAEEIRKGRAWVEIYLDETGARAWRIRTRHEYGKAREENEPLTGAVETENIVAEPLGIPMIDVTTAYEQVLYDPPDLAADRDALLAQTDLMTDEFARIKALLHGSDAPYSSEIRDLCDRAISDVHRKVPVIADLERTAAERDALARRVGELEAEVKRLTPTKLEQMAAELEFEL